jgi:penicillin-binding protein 3
MNIVEGESAPRGRIYDRNHNLLVDNVGEKVIFYKKQKSMTAKDEMDLAYSLANALEINYNYLSSYNLKDFWIANNMNAAYNKITNEERELQRKRKLSNNEIDSLIRERITKEELNKYNELDKEAAYIYYLMNKGYSYEEKIIKNSNITDYEYAYIAENLNKFKGIGVKLDWKRKYLYDDTLRGIFGTVSSSTQGIPYELKDYYLNKGYNLNDRVGLTYLEYQ